MSSSNLIRLGGLAAVVGGVLFVIAELLYLVVGMFPSAKDLASGSAIVQGLLFALGGMLLVGALIGLYVSRKDELGVLGAAGFIIAFVGSTFAMGTFWGGAFVVPTLAEIAPELVDAGPPPLVVFADITAFALLTIGWLLLGLASCAPGSTRAGPRCCLWSARCSRSSRCRSAWSPSARRWLGRGSRYSRASERGVGGTEGVAPEGRARVR